MPVHDWSGFYAGVHAGYGWSRPKSTLETLLNGTPLSLASQDLEEVPDSYRVRADGFVGGGQIGFNVQSSRTVFGIEADLSYSGLDGDVTAAGSVTSGGPPVTYDFRSTRSQKLEWLGTLRGRLGYTPSDSLLLYATGGLALGRVEDSMRLSFLGVGGSTFAGASAATRAGWTAGAGAEYRISGNLSAKLEYLYFDLGSSSLVGLDVNFPNQPFQTQSRFDHNGHIARVGLNYRFGAPVTAKY